MSYSVSWNWEVSVPDPLSVAFHNPPADALAAAGSASSADAKATPRIPRALIRAPMPRTYPPNATAARFSSARDGATTTRAAASELLARLAWLAAPPTLDG